jgi:hypothetical protein
MIDVKAIIRAWIASLPELTSAFGKRVYAGRYLPSGYLPGQGPACLFAPRSGEQDFSSHLFAPSIQFRVYAETEAKAEEASRLLYDALNDQQYRQISYARMEDGTFPQLLSEPGSDWPYVLLYFKFHVQN